MKALKNVWIISALIAVMILFVNITTARAADDITVLTSGDCSDDNTTYPSNVTYTLTSDGIFRVSGNGYMESYYVYNNVPTMPWIDYRDSIKEVIIEDGVFNAAYGGFVGCNNLKKVTLADSVINIEPSAFSACTALTDINVENIGWIGASAFADCSALERVNCQKDSYLGEQAFAACYGLKEITLGEGLTEIGETAFYQCISLESINIPSTTETIGFGAFGYCTSLERAVIPESVTVINGNTFYGCRSLKSVEISQNVTSIGSYVFYGCSNLSCVYLYENSYADKFMTENNGSIARKYITDDNAVQISEIDTENNRLKLLIDTNKLGGSPENARYLEQVNVIVDDEEQGVKYYVYDDTEQYAVFEIEYINNSADSADIRAEAKVKESDDSFKYYVTEVYSID